MGDKKDSLTSIVIVFFAIFLQGMNHILMKLDAYVRSMKTQEANITLKLV